MKLTLNHQTRKNLFSAAFAFAAALLSLPSQGAINVLACEPEWEALTSELGGGKVKVSSATTAR